MKKLQFICQSKGGSGKSILTFLLAEKYKKAIILDLDEATKTSSLQLAYRDPKKISFMNAENNIDRGLFDTFMETVASSKNGHFLCDLGGTTSEQLTIYFKQMGSELKPVLTDMGINLELYVVVSGGNNFVQTITYLDELVLAGKSDFQIKVFKNEYYDFTSDQTTALESYCELHELDLIPYTISVDRNETTQNRIIQVLNAGKGTSELTSFNKLYFNKALDMLSKGLDKPTEEKVKESTEE